MNREWVWVVGFYVLFSYRVLLEPENDVEVEIDDVLHRFDAVRLPRVGEQTKGYHKRREDCRGGCTGSFVPCLEGDRGS